MGSISMADHSTDASNTRSKTPTALIKGAGPSGLAAAVSLAQLDFLVTVVEKRPWRPYGQGRKNMVAVRPDTLRILDELGALRYLDETGAWTDMVGGQTIDQWDDGVPVLEWGPLLVRYPHRYAEKYRLKNIGGTEYQVPASLKDQLPSSYVDIGDLEDALLKVCYDMNNVSVVNEATIVLDLNEADEKYEATVVEKVGTVDEQQKKLGSPDLIVCASGKNDTALAQELGFRRHRGARLDEDTLPRARSRMLKLGKEGELESQLFAAFGVKAPEKPNGVIWHSWRKDGTGTPPQPLCEIEMCHKNAVNFIMHLPRDMDVTDEVELERYVIDQVNLKLDTKYRNIEEIKAQNMLTAGNPLQPVLVETSTAPKFVYGSNVALIGDCAICCSPSSGIGCDIGVHDDSQNIRRLGTHHKALDAVESEGERARLWEQALDDFNLRKAESAVMWSQGSRKFYISGQEAETIVKRLNQVQLV